MVEGVSMSAFTDETLLVKTTGGIVRGSLDGDTHRWLGIPYASPPVGSLRFQPSQPVQPWQGIKDQLG